VTIDVTSRAAGVDRPGRLGDPNRSLRDDPRADPRMVAAFAALGAEGHPEATPVTADSPLEAQLEYAAAAEQGFEGLMAALVAGVPPVAGVTSETVTITGPDGDELKLYVHRPTGASGPLPCIYHVHGGGMVLIRASNDVYQRLRDELAASGLVVVGVEFRNGGGVLGNHPFPAGLEDCAAWLRWTADHLDELGASHVVVMGESGGANLSLALTHKAKREGWLDVIKGVYAQCPYISNEWADPPARLASLVENDGFFIGVDSMPVLASVYDPGGANIDDPTCWPLRATDADLAGMPPHVISVNELDPLRDEGIEYYRRLRDAGTSAVGRMVLGTVHGSDVFCRAAMPDVYAATIRDVNGFANSLR